MSDALSATAVIRAEPDGYDMAKVELMGRQSAGNGFLRAAVQGRGDHPIYGFSPLASSADGFRAMVRRIDPAAAFEFIPAPQLERIGGVGVLYLADSTVATHARQRQRAGLTSFSVCGVTHTTASTTAMDEIVGLLREPVAPWDALVCTSTSVVETVRRLHELERDYQRWRYGAEIRGEPPQLPLIPLGVHCDDYACDDDARVAARAALGLEPDEVAALFVGRLVYHAKAHPYPMFRGLQAAAERTGRKVVLVMAGWFPNEPVAEAFKDGARRFAPDVRCLWIDGRKPDLRDHCWAGSDIFVSLPDNIQETFGLTPIEAMAAGLPVVVSDWDGYKDTVRHGVDGFRVRTLMPQAGMGQALARALETASLNYDHYSWAAAQATAVDIADFTEVVSALIENPDMRRRMGAAGRARAREVYDWSVIYRQYQALWTELNARRRSAANDPAMQAWIAALPRAAPARPDPFAIFEHYPTATFGRHARVALAPGATRAELDGLLAHPLFGARASTDETTRRIFDALLAGGELTLAELAARSANNEPTALRNAALLAKLGLATIHAAPGA
ncbi:MAG: glycosyltransferase family 4 protein [Phenylobacterium sp.]|uniref:glycosyltransferase family 4 protein n=1 Tax=Phenylobacterium sp. TaxID=1871053 RepID=UPI001A440E04|nr:glycosyltransferase family 4 protein [Phenylobacterium sp.]MBL8552957.1 glycosyltransferase family 4 protein [Phenylobacterium sp.]